MGVKELAEEVDHVVLLQVGEVFEGNQVEAFLDLVGGQREAKGGGNADGHGKVAVAHGGGPDGEPVNVVLQSKAGDQGEHVVKAGGVVKDDPFFQEFAEQVFFGDRGKQVSPVAVLFQEPVHAENVAMRAGFDEGMFKAFKGVDRVREVPNQGLHGVEGVSSGSGGEEFGEGQDMGRVGGGRQSQQPLHDWPVIIAGSSENGAIDDIGNNVGGVSLVQGHQVLQAARAAESQEVFGGGGVGGVNGLHGPAAAAVAGCPAAWSGNCFLCPAALAAWCE